MEAVLTAAGRMLCPGVDVEAFAKPSHWTLRNIILKLDLLHSLSRRFFAPPSLPGSSSIQVSRFLSLDSSPQANHDYLLTTEDVLVRPWSVALEGGS
jgi:hypothetical protein